MKYKILIQELNDDKSLKTETEWKCKRLSVNEDWPVKKQYDDVKNRYIFSRLPNSHILNIQAVIE